MKTEQLNKAFDEYSDLLMSLGCENHAQGLKKFSSLLGRHPNITVAAFVKKIQKGREKLGQG